MGRQSRAIGFAILFLPLLLWMSCSMQAGKIVKTEKVEASILEMKTLPPSSPGMSPVHLLKLKLQNGRDFSLKLYSNPPEPQQKIPLLIQTRADGRELIRLDAEKWQALGF
ncbi:hypothetical protein COW36_10970 [bacterium (Candidatus Blackallbacteria) CG17_big_fil_post_rev_8_21_14_2_50_48_46]|uniref:Uncharacterized protein n=1 Tax=bacterium (Candidatus Blackallbacteria) CG17_big_fil_post_rev_8_21_14_2_50_48_46 TaxID=2014261 RepID=A0A2M7G539_9BACT|nr:MAG: hypothetical protein COW64_18065 [bacterium (Candidatus Blackallbacteria) CG18_big_fil_WC_8_21_14_2_50_49_26]PIW16910.1 MAG: hypothetical protein COW36_10970 [bacterium (Candidatus Blackallbacteria) CG17_big_fil_post_rev_8_21_14_2_50_48_46]PIW49328.1 MAG: hypothetical protein COW20_06280 [bacterium (Candidatus Blackallbacteria) CG13_big_fil_rev_8_21_14_2_50_49_14]